MIVIHATKKLRDRVHTEPPAAAEASTGRLGSRYANVLFVRPQVALFVNETTLVPLLTPLARRPTCSAGSAALGQLLSAHQLPQASSIARWQRPTSLAWHRRPAGACTA